MKKGQPQLRRGVDEGQVSGPIPWSLRLPYFGNTDALFRPISFWLGRPEDTIQLEALIREVANMNTFRSRSSCRNFCCRRRRLVYSQLGGREKGELLGGAVSGVKSTEELKPNPIDALDK